MRQWCAGKCLWAELPVSRMECLGILRGHNLLGRGRAGVGVHLPFLLQRWLRPALPPLAPFPPLASLFKLLPLCWVSVGPAEAPGLHKRLVCQLPLCSRGLFSRPANQQNPVQGGLMLPTQLSRARGAEFLGACPLPAPFLFLLPLVWDGGRASSRPAVAPPPHPSLCGPLCPAWRSSVLQPSGCFQG